MSTLKYNLFLTCKFYLANKTSLTYTFIILTTTALKRNMLNTCICSAMILPQTCGSTSHVFVLTLGAEKVV